MPTTISCTFTAISDGEGTFCIQALQEHYIRGITVEG
jgi:hypothetical protein